MTSHRRVALALGVCAVATAAELTGGGLTGSVALTADGLHSLVHVGALSLALVGALMARKAGPHAARLAGLANSLFIAGLAVLLGIESIQRLMAPEPVLYDPALAVTGLGLLANLATVAALGGGSPEDLNHRAALAHMLGDAAVAVLALVGLGAGRLFHLPWADPAAGLAGRAFWS